MKKHLIISLIILCVSTVYSTVAYPDLYTHPFPFIGRWNPTENPALLDNFGLQDIQNVRKWGKHFRGVLGDSAINTEVISGNSSYFRPRSGHHFKKDNPTQSYILVQAFNDTESESQIYYNNTAVPNRGDFSGTTLHGDDPDSDIGRFATFRGNEVYCNQKESLIWGGEERQIHGFLIETVTSGVSPIASDYWEKIYKNDSDTYTVFSGGQTTFYIGSTRRFNSAEFRIKTANTSTATMTASYYSGWSWVPVSNLSDGTSSGGNSIAIDGTVSWDYTTSSSLS